MTTKHTVAYMARDEVLAFDPPASAHLLSISNDESDQAPIDEARWASVSYHHFVDGGYTVELMRDLGDAFLGSFDNHIMPAQAATIRSRVQRIVSHGEPIVVNCEEGRSRSAAVALWISNTFDYALDQDAANANETVLAMLNEDEAMMAQFASLEQSGQTRPEPRPLWKRLIARFTGG